MTGDPERRRRILRHQNRRSTHLVTHAGDDHRRGHDLVTCQVNVESTTEVAVAHIGPQRPVQRATLFSVKYARILVPNLRYLARQIAAAPRAHPAPTLRSAHAPSSLHPERHYPHRSYSTIPCIENRRCAPRGQRSPQVPAAEAKRNARDPPWYAMRARLGPSASPPAPP